MIIQGQRAVAQYVEYNLQAEKLNQFFLRVLEDLKNNNYELQPIGPNMKNDMELHKGLASCVSVRTLVFLNSWWSYFSSTIFLAFFFQLMCNCCKGTAMMLHNVLRTRYGIDYGISMFGLIQTFIVSSLPFVTAEFFFSLGSKRKYLRANLIPAYVLNFGMCIEKLVQYAFAIGSGEFPTGSDWIVFFGVVLAAIVGIYTA
jgi:hypothetical protein